MPFVKKTWAFDDIITEVELNRMETQYDAAKADLDGHTEAADPHPQYATDVDLAAKASLDSPIFTGPVTLSADPAAALQATTKQYVDAEVAKAKTYAP